MNCSFRLTFEFFTIALIDTMENENYYFFIYLITKCINDEGIGIFPYIFDVLLMNVYPMFSLYNLSKILIFSGFKLLM